MAFREIGHSRAKKNESKAIFDTNIYTSRINRSIINRIGYTDLIKALDNFNITQSFKNITNAQDFLKHIQETNDEIIKNNVKKFITLKINNIFYVVPIISIQIKINKKIKEIDIIIMPYEEPKYPIHIGRKEMKEYLISY
jgi:hypothetical protein